jgi:glucose/arabinose dehydrogenase
MYKRLMLIVLIMLLTVSLPVFAQEATPEPITMDPNAFTVETVMDRIFVTSIVWASDGRMFWTEKDGVVGTMAPDGTIQEEPVIKLEVQTFNEQGLLSIALDPKFDENHLFYLFYTLPASIDNAGPINVITRFEYVDGIAQTPVRLFRIDIPANSKNEYVNLHNGGRLKFGPEDGFLYVSIGDLGMKSAGQDFNVMTGKLHRFAVSNNTLLPAPGNPFAGNSTWVTGVRNTFGFTFDPMTGLILATENGPECDDEINLLIPGQNYGWTADIDCNAPQALRQAAGIPPLVSWTPTIAPTGIILYDGAVFPEWKDAVFYCAWNPQVMGVFRLNEKHTRFVGDGVLVPLPKDKACAIEVAEGPDGYIYYSNIMGVYRIVPAEQ